MVVLHVHKGGAQVGLRKRATAVKEVLLALILLHAGQIILFVGLARLFELLVLQLLIRCAASTIRPIRR